MATIADVARKAGVSRTAVSFAFNDPSRLSRETLARILAVSHDLGYYPNPAARSLISKHVGVIGLLIPQHTAMLFANPFFAELLRSIGQVCDEQDLAVLLVPPVHGSVTRALSRAATDGFIVVGLHGDHPAIATLRHRQKLFVVVDGPAVTIADQAGACQAAVHLLALGHRELLVIAIQPAVGERGEYGKLRFSSVAERRLAGYRQAFEERGILWREQSVVAVDSTREGGALAFRQVWDTGFHPTAVLAMSDIIALGVIDAALALGLSVPEHLAVVGFDDIPAARWCQPGLTTIHQSAMEKGICATQLLIEHREARVPERHCLLPTALIVRSSTAPPRSGL
jgi:DNA-binding LacI/PurR family transcriptional regulator